MQFTSGILGLFFAIAVMYLLRRDHIKISHALFWIAFAAGGLVFGLFPKLSDRIASLFSVAYGPTLIIVISIAALVLRSIITDIQVTRIERDIRVLTQKLGAYGSSQAGLVENSASKIIDAQSNT